MGTAVELQTKVLAWAKGKELGNYSVRLKQREGKEIILEIEASEGTYGKWSWYLSSLLGLYSNHGISDTLSLDFGQGWAVTGMKEVYNEVMTKIHI